MSVRRRLLGVFLVYLAILVIGGAVILGLTRSRDDARDQQRSIEIARERVIQLRAAFVDQETGERGYLLTGEESFLVPFHAGHAAATRLLASTQFRTTTFAPLTRRVLEAWSTWERAFAGPEIELRRTAGEEAAAAQVATGAGKQKFDALRSRVASLDQAAAKASTDVDAQLDDRRNMLSMAVGVVLSVAIVWTIIAAWLVRTWVSRPLAQLGRAVRAARAGARDTKIPAAGPEEIAELGADVEAMRLQLVGALREAVRAREAIEQSATVVLTLRSELEGEIGELPDDWTIAAELRAAEGIVAGDCYDVLRTDPTKVHIMVVDISGHGAISGILALRCRELIRAALRSGLAPGAALDFAAEQLDNLGDEEFLSAFVATVNLEDGEVQFANAGHPPGMLCNSEHAVELAPTGPIVGPIPRARWTTAAATIEPGGTLALFTDGILEARNAAREQFGWDRLESLVCGSSCDEAAAIAKLCVDEVASYQTGRIADDVTVVLVCRGPRSSR